MPAARSCWCVSTRFRADTPDPSRSILEAMVQFLANTSLQAGPRVDGLLPSFFRKHRLAEAPTSLRICRRDAEWPSRDNQPLISPYLAPTDRVHVPIDR